MPPVFISYSRKDFYFAESLAFHLTRNGIPNWLDANHLAPGRDWAADIDRALDEAVTVIVVLTRDSVRSHYVRGEWQRALAQGDRIVLVQFRSCAIPAELQHAEVIDFRGRFVPALQRLVTTLSTPNVVARQTRFRLLRVPPWVAVVTIFLALLFVIPMALYGSWDTADAEPEPIWEQVLFWIAAPFLLWLIVWHACVAFVRRRMGMTRLALMLSFFTGLFAAYLVGKLQLVATVTAWFAGPLERIPVPVLITVICIGVIALAIVTLVRPEDLLRWCPTGKAWDSYRRGRVIPVQDIPTRFAQIGPFQLLHDIDDAPAATHLRAALIATGASEAAETATATKIVLLTNRTRTAWVSQQNANLFPRLVTIVGTAINLPQSLSQLGRRQWIDFRRWDARKRHHASIPAVPEAMTRLRVPGVVLMNEHLLCALAGLLLNLTLPRLSEENVVRQTFGLLLAATCATAVVLAWRIIQRSITRRGYLRGVTALMIATPLLVPPALWLLVSSGHSFLYVLAPVAFLIPTLIMLRREVSRLEFWLPPPAESGTKYAERLKPKPKWEPIVWVYVYTTVWMVLLGLQG